MVKCYLYCGGSNCSSETRENSTTCPPSWLGNRKLIKIFLRKVSFYRHPPRLKKPENTMIYLKFTLHIDHLRLGYWCGVYFETGAWHLQTADCRLRTADRRLQTADCRSQIAHCKLNDTKNLPNKGDKVDHSLLRWHQQKSCESEKVAWEQGWCFCAKLHWPHSQDAVGYSSSTLSQLTRHITSCVDSLFFFDYCELIMTSSNAH